MTSLALVTGASAGIGAAIARALVAENRQVILLARNLSRLQNLANELGQKAHVLQMDITDFRAIDSLPSRLSALGPIDILVNNAGHDVGGRNRFDKCQFEEVTSIIQTNLVATMRL